MGQLGNRIQHALRAFTAKDRKNLKLAAETYRENPRFSTEDAIKEVGVGEAVTSFLEAKGAPSIVERTLIRPPSSQLGPITEGQRRETMNASPIAGKYEAEKDRESAYEVLRARADKAAAEAEEAERLEEEAEVAERELKQARRYDGTQVGRSTSRRSSKSGGIGDQLTKMVMKELTGTTGKRIVRGILGGLFRGR